MHREAMKDGVLSGALKEVIALVIAVQAECDGCIAYTAPGAARKGPPRSRWPSAWVALLMMGRSGHHLGAAAPGRPTRSTRGPAGQG